MNAITVNINNQNSISVGLEGVISVIVIHHKGETSITMSGLQDDSEGGKERLVWMEQQLVEEDTVSIRLTDELHFATEPKLKEAVNYPDADDMKLKKYYALKKELEERNLI